MAQARVTLQQFSSESNTDLKGISNSAKIIEGVCENANNHEAILAFMNELLAEPATLDIALKILHSVVDKLPEQLVRENGLVWVNHCMRNGTLSVSTMKVMGKLISICNGYEDFDSFLSSNMQILINSCISRQIRVTQMKYVLECLLTCIEKYPVACARFQKEIENYLCLYISSNQSTDKIKLVGRVFHCLQKVKTSEDSDEVLNWTTQLNKLCFSLHIMYNDFLRDTPGFAVHEEICVSPFPKIYFLNNGNDFITRRTNTATVLRNVLIIINSMIVEEFPHPKCVPATTILHVIRRGLMVDIYEQLDESIQKNQFAMLLREHQIDLLYLLRSLMCCLNLNLIPVAPLITKLIVVCLESVQGKPFWNNLKYHITIYKVLTCWITIMKNNLNPNFHNKIISLILLDITTEKDRPTVLLEKGLHRQARKLCAPTQSDMVPKNNSEQDVNAKVCLSALKALNTLLQFVSLQLDENNFKVLFSTITNKLEAANCDKGIHPHINTKCKDAFYKSLSLMLQQKIYRKEPFNKLAKPILKRKLKVLVNNYELPVIISNALCNIFDSSVKRVKQNGFSTI